MAAQVKRVSSRNSHESLETEDTSLVKRDYGQSNVKKLLGIYGPNGGSNPTRNRTKRVLDQKPPLNSRGEAKGSALPRLPKIGSNSNLSQPRYGSNIGNTYSSILDTSTRPKVVNERLKYVYRPSNASKYVNGVNKPSVDERVDTINHNNISPARGGGLDSMKGIKKSVK